LSHHAQEHIGKPLL